jgi:hypothetical protein
MSSFSRRRKAALNCGAKRILANGLFERFLLFQTARYDSNDENLTVAAAFWTRLMERFL